MIPLKSNDSDDLKRYYSSEFITDGLYADAKAAYMRVEDAMNRAKQLMRRMVVVYGLKVWKWATNQAKFEIASQAFDTITQRYNI
ncbi:MAG: hypothetical protein ACLT8V_00855 [Streptococcus salivarius]